MNLFHYHYWTQDPEAMERFYGQLGFQVTLRSALRDRQTILLNPPLGWDDFRAEGVTFRTIEMRKGKTNVTFGHGKRTAFDHIGFLVNREEYLGIVERAHDCGWYVREGERRTFITTPWRWRVELQQRSDVVTEDDDLMIRRMDMMMQFDIVPKQLGKVLGVSVDEDRKRHVVQLSAGPWTIQISPGHTSSITSIVFSSRAPLNTMDPCGVHLWSEKRAPD